MSGPHEGQLAQLVGRLGVRPVDTHVVLTCAASIEEWVAAEEGAHVGRLTAAGVFGALVDAFAEQADDTSFALEIVCSFSRMASIADAARALARASGCIENLAMLMRTQTHAVALIQGCFELVSALCVDDETAGLVGQPLVFGAISTGMWLHGINSSLVLRACAALARARASSEAPPPPQIINALSAAIIQQLERVPYLPQISPESSPEKWQEQPASERRSRFPSASNEHTPSDECLGSVSVSQRPVRAEDTRRVRAVEAAAEDEGLDVDSPHEVRQIVYEACSALRNLFCDEECRRVALSEGGASALWRALIGMADDVRIIDAACGALAKLASMDIGFSRIGTPEATQQLHGMFISCRSRPSALPPLLALALELSRATLALDLLSQFGVVRLVCHLIEEHLIWPKVVLGCVRLLASACRPRKRGGRGPPMLASMLDSQASSAALSGLLSALRTSCEKGSIASADSSRSEEGVRDGLGRASSPPGKEGDQRLTATAMDARDEILIHAGSIIAAFSHEADAHAKAIVASGGIESFIRCANVAGCSDAVRAAHLDAAMACMPQESSAMFCDSADAINLLLEIAEGVEEGSALSEAALALLSSLLSMQAPELLVEPTSRNLNPVLFPKRLDADEAEESKDVTHKDKSGKKVGKRTRAKFPTSDSLPQSSGSDIDEDFGFSRGPSIDALGLEEEDDDWVGPPQTGVGRELPWPGIDFLEERRPPREPLSLISKGERRARAAEMRRRDCEAIQRARFKSGAEALVYHAAVNEAGDETSPHQEQMQPPRALMVAAVAANAEAKHVERTRAGIETRMAHAMSAAPVTPSAAIAGPSLSFDSSFESMNLQRATRVAENEYNLTMTNDTRTTGHTQWYYFRVRGAKPGVSYKFNIINMQKGRSLYENGLRPLLYSEKRASSEGIGWRRVGSDVCYYTNFYPRPTKSGRPTRTYHTLTFTVTFPLANDTCYLAHCYPYTYSDLQRDLRALSEDPQRGEFVNRQALCTTLAGNRCDVLTITNFGAEAPVGRELASAFDRPGSARKKRAVVLSARVHPGETNASYIMHGLLLALTADNERASALRDEFVFVVVPMLNPDGVINGNYRCSLAGCDLNRLWDAPHKHIAPPIYALKTLMRELKRTTELTLFCDFHGHSRKENAFIYGCHNNKDPNKKFHERLFPRLLSMECVPFSFDDCTFKMQESKKSTARIVCRKELGLLNSFTLEVSFAGTTLDVEEPYHFSQDGYRALGRDFVNALHKYTFLQQEEINEQMCEIEQVVREQTAAASLPGAAGSVGDSENDKMDDEDSDSGGSDDDPLDGSFDDQTLNELWASIKASRANLAKRRRRRIQALNEKQRELPRRKPRGARRSSQDVRHRSSARGHATAVVSGCASSTTGSTGLNDRSGGGGSGGGRGAGAGRPCESIEGSQVPRLRRRNSTGGMHCGLSDDAPTYGGLGHDDWSSRFPKTKTNTGFGSSEATGRDAPVVPPASPSPAAAEKALPAATSKLVRKPRRKLGRFDAAVVAAAAAKNVEREDSGEAQGTAESAAFPEDEMIHHRDSSVRLDLDEGHDLRLTTIHLANKVHADNVATVSAETMLAQDSQLVRPSAEPTVDFAIAELEERMATALQTDVSTSPLRSASRTSTPNLVPPAVRIGAHSTLEMSAHLGTTVGRAKGNWTTGAVPRSKSRPSSRHASASSSISIALGDNTDDYAPHFRALVTDRCLTSGDEGLVAQLLQEAASVRSESPDSLRDSPSMGAFRASQMMATAEPTTILGDSPAQTRCGDSGSCEDEEVAQSIRELARSGSVSKVHLERRNALSTRSALLEALASDRRPIFGASSNSQVWRGTPALSIRREVPPNELVEGASSAVFVSSATRKEGSASGASSLAAQLAPRKEAPCHINLLPVNLYPSTTCHHEVPSQPPSSTTGSAHVTSTQGAATFMQAYGADVRTPGSSTLRIANLHGVSLSDGTSSTDSGTLRVVQRASETSSSRSHVGSRASAPPHCRPINAEMGSNTTSVVNLHRCASAAPQTNESRRGIDRYASIGATSPSPSAAKTPLLSTHSKHANMQKARRGARSESVSDSAVDNRAVLLHLAANTYVAMPDQLGSSGVGTYHRSSSPTELTSDAGSKSMASGTAAVKGPSWKARNCDLPLSTKSGLAVAAAARQASYVGDLNDVLMRRPLKASGSRRRRVPTGNPNLVQDSVHMQRGACSPGTHQRLCEGLRSAPNIRPSPSNIRRSPSAEQ